MANKLRVSKSGSGAPTAITPDFLGQIYIDEDTGTRYEATALTEGSWVDKLSLKENVANKKTTLTDNSDTFYPTQKAVKTAVDAKQDTLGFTPENVVNKKTTLTDSDVDYPTCKAVNTGLSAKQNTLGFTPENVANKKTDLSDNSDIYYPSQKAVKTAVDAKQDALGFTPENVTNKLTSFQTTPDDTHYPSEKLVKNSLDTKAPSASPTFTGTVTLPKAVNVKDTSADHEYQLGVSELAANRTVTLPLLTGNDTFMFKDFHKASSAEINTGTEDNKYTTPDGLAGSNIGTRMIQLKVCDDATALTTGDGKIIFMIPEEMNGMNLVKAHAMVSTVSSSGTPTIQIRNVTDGVDMLSTRITIDVSEYTSYTAATAPVIDTTKDDVATGDRIAIDVDVAGTGAKGLTIFLAFRLP